MPKIICLSGMNKGEEFELFEGGNTLGRSEQSRICVFDKKASRVHCVITLQNKKIYLQDNGSTNGTKINNVFVTSQKELNVGDHIRLGQTVFLVSDKPLEKDVTDTTRTLKKKYEALFEQTSFQVTKTTALRKMRSEKNGRETGFLSFFQKDNNEEEEKKKGEEEKDI